MPLSIGEEKAKAAKQLTITKDIPIEYLDTKCQECKLAKACPTCIGSNYNDTNNLYSKSDGYCKLVKRMLLANSYFKWKL